MRKIDCQIKFQYYYQVLQRFTTKLEFASLPLPVVLLTAVRLDFINENKNDIKKANTTTTTTEIFKCYKISMLFDAQNTGNRISKLLDFKFFGGGGGHAPRSP